MSMTGTVRRRVYCSSRHKAPQESSGAANV